MSKLSVCPSCGKRQVQRPDIDNRAVASAPASMVVRCSACGAEFTLGKFFRVGDRVSVGGIPAVVESLLTWSPGLFIRFADGSKGAVLFFDVDRE